jgi:hypothetical protein
MMGQGIGVGRVVCSYQVSRVLVSSWFSPLRRELPVAREMLR